MATKHKSVPELLRRRRIQWPVLALIIIFVVGAGYALVRMSFAASGVMQINPQINSAVSLGSTVTFTVTVNGGTDTLNAAEADLTYPTALLQFVSISTAGSPFTSSAQATGGNGVVTIASGIGGGAAPISGTATLATVTFKGIGIGSANIGLAATSVGLRPSDSTNVITVRNGTNIPVSDLTAPTIPTGVVKTSSSLTSVTLGWTASTDNVAVTGYRIFRGGTQVGSIANTATTYTDSGLTPGTAYSYTIAAVDATGNISAQSAPVSLSTSADTTAPAVPTNITATSRTLTGITLSWTASTDDVKTTGYTVYRSAGTAGPVQVGTTTSVGFSDTGLLPGGTYSYQITAHDAAGNTSAKSTAVDLATLADTTAPTVPTGLAAGPQTNGNVALAWTASTDNVAVIGYKVYRNGTQVSAAVGGASTSLTNGNFPLPTTAGNYSFTVAAFDAAGNTSAQSSAVVITVAGTADINRDGKVNITDLSMLLSAWGKTGANAADINGDSVVNITDLSKLLSSWTG